MTTDYRTEDQKVAAVRASMRMAGYDITPDDEARGRRILRGEITGDQAVLEVMEAQGYGDCERAQFLRQRIAKTTGPKNGTKDAPSETKDVKGRTKSVKTRTKGAK
ncbi:antitoxin VbhA family protein [Corynebacterium auriscanis]|uniref:antitoxin VbhA family protein n=1 Tax=Corynebacterium auriscanis TaxID=99807 RepID=UPI0024AE67AB|nr:antitoxin VbhA family protein [Corynebacterium auriscanis]